jgi:hypothetical protein
MQPGDEGAHQRFVGIGSMLSGDCRL